MQIGSPATLSEAAIKTYLYEFLSNKKVVDLPHFIWLPILENIILRFRAKKLFKRYEKIWDGQEFLLVKQTRLLCEKIKTELKSQNIECDYAFYYGKKTIQDISLAETSSVVLLPLFPQYSRSTWGILEELRIEGVQVKWISPFYEEDFFIDNVFQKIYKKLVEIETNQTAVEVVLISFHSVPLRQIKKYQDPYLIQCEKTFQKLKAKLAKKISCQNIVMCFQSKFGKGRWAKPLLGDLLEHQFRGKKVVVVSPSFVSDSLETLVEINEELRESVEREGGALYYVDCPNLDDGWVKGLANFCLKNIKSDMD